MVESSVNAWSTHYHDECDEMLRIHESNVLYANYCDNSISDTKVIFPPLTLLSILKKKLFFSKPTMSVVEKWFHYFLSSSASTNL